MIYSDGAGLNYQASDDDTGMLSYGGTYAMDEANVFLENHTTLI
jgi:hypothetical protein